MSVKALDLFQAYGQDKLPSDGGYIVSSFLREDSKYARYEVVAYNNVKALYLSEDGLTFQSDGNKLFVLAEPPTYPKKHLEPFRRDTQFQIPHRFAELEIITARNQAKVMVSKDPIFTYSSFTIMKPAGINFAFIFYNQAEVLESIRTFFRKTLNKEAGIPQSDADSVADIVVGGLKRFSIWSHE